MCKIHKGKKKSENKPQRNLHQFSNQRTHLKSNMLHLNNAYSERGPLNYHTEVKNKEYTIDLSAVSPKRN